MYGGSFSQQDAPGIISHTINALSPNTTYYFKINASNGCAAGPTSNIVQAKTTGSSKTVAKFYKNTSLRNTKTVSKISNKQPKTANTGKISNPSPSLLPVVPDNKIEQSLPSTPKTNEQQITPQTPPKHGFLNTIVSFIKNLF
jgi:hypothetical protein